MPEVFAWHPAADVCAMHRMVELRCAGSVEPTQGEQTAQRLAVIAQEEVGTTSATQPEAIIPREPRRHTGRLIVFVCTGNTCRSPLAEALCKARLAERMACTPAELAERGFHILSAGLAAMSGGPAAGEAIEVARAYGADLSGHRSQPLTPELAAQADFLVAMTRGHLLILTEAYQGLTAAPRLLSPEGGDLPDPIGYPLYVYEECARQIWDFLGPLIDELQQPASKAPPNS